MPRDSEILEKIIELTKNRSPETVEKLTEMAVQELDIPRDLALEYVIELENQGRLKLSSPMGAVPEEFNAYLLSTHASWFWIIIAIAIFTVISVLTIPENAVPYIYIRYILGSIFMIFLPGYSLVKTLFPSKKRDKIERTGLSIGMSLAVVPLIGLLLNYTPWGIRFTPVFLSLLIFTIFFTITGLYREHKEMTSISYE